MDLIDRLGFLVRSWFALDDDAPSSSIYSRTDSADSDYLDAMRELDEYLDVSKTETERRENEERQRRERMARAEAERRYRSSGAQGSTAAQKAAEARRALEGAYATLELPYGTAFPEVKVAYKRLMKKHHPDLNAGSPEMLKRATAMSSRINVAYQMIEAWEASGRATLG